MYPPRIPEKSLLRSQTTDTSTSPGPSSHSSSSSPYRSLTPYQTSQSSFSSSSSIYSQSTRATPSPSDRPKAKHRYPPVIPPRTSSLNRTGAAPTQPLPLRTTHRNPSSSRPCPSPSRPSPPPSPAPPHPSPPFRFSTDWQPYTGHLNPLFATARVPVDPTGDHHAPWAPVTGPGGIYHKEHASSSSRGKHNAFAQEKRKEEANRNSGRSDFVKAYGRAEDARLPKNWNAPTLRYDLGREEFEERGEGGGMKRRSKGKGKEKHKDTIKDECLGRDEVKRRYREEEYVGGWI